jgi:NAD(P) transhydrogenase subunit alpha
MIISTIREASPETRVSITPTAVKHYLKMGIDVALEHHAGQLSGFSDESYKKAGATVVTGRKILLKQTNILVCVNEPTTKDLTGLQPHSLLISPIDDLNGPLLKWCAKHDIHVFSMNHIPRISRAQTIDSLSSQANLAGYRAIIEAAAHYNRVIPMMMTAAGMIQPANVLILGAGVAGLQAIATAKRLGAVVHVFDVRAAAKEQVQSLNAEFIEVSGAQDHESASGYAQETSKEYQRLQSELINKHAKLADIIICTALIPGKKSPRLISKSTVKQMKPGAVIVDLATARGGNCEGSVLDKITHIGEVTIIGYGNLARLVPATASELYANNLVQLITLLTHSSATLDFNPEDTVIQQAMLCHAGQLMPFQSTEEKQRG